MPAKTSEDLKIIKGGIRNLKENINSLGLKVRVLKDSLDDESALIKEEILEFKDEMLGEVKAMREELTVALGQYSRHEDTLENHEERLSKLEKPFA